MARLRPVPDLPPRAVLYLRQSVSRDDSISLELQETACRDYCARRGYTVVEVIADPGISGRTWNRPGVQRTLDLIESGAADVIVLWRWSRLSRSRKDWAVAVDRVEVAGGSIESATEPVDTTTAAGRLQRGMLAELAAWESEVKGEQWREAQARRRSLGLPHSGGYRPGYLYEGKSYRPDPEVAPLVVEAYERFVSGVGTRKLAEWMGLVGIPCRVSGARWTYRGAQRMLDSGWAAGLLHVHDPACGCPNKSGSCGRRIHVPGAHEAIISTRLWRAYEAERRRRTVTPRRLLTPSTPLSGLVRCEACRYGMRVKNSPRGRGRIYACTHPGCPRPTTVTLGRAEAEALAWLGRYAHDVEEQLALVASQRTARVAAQATVTRLARAVNQLDAELAKLTREYARGVVPESAYVAARDEMLAERAGAEAALAESAAAVSPNRPSPQVAGRLLAEWDVLDVAVRNRLCRELLRVVVARGERRSVVHVDEAWNWRDPGKR